MVGGRSAAVVQRIFVVRLTFFLLTQDTVLWSEKTKGTNNSKDEPASYIYEQLSAVDASLDLS